MTEQEQQQFDNVTKERDAAITERDAAITERDNVTKERDEIKKKYADNFAKGEKDDAEKLEKEIVEYFKKIF